jgi:hypothetical protein
VCISFHFSVREEQRGEKKPESCGREKGKRLSAIAAGGRWADEPFARGMVLGLQEFAEWALEFADALIREGESRAYQRSRERLAHGAAQAEKLLNPMAKL